MAVRECATGRGLFAVSTIPADTLLVASTAFALSSDGLEALPAAVCQRLRSRPDLGPALYELSPGPGFGAPPLGEAASGVDAARIAAICAENAFCAVDEVEAAVLTERWAEREARRDGTGRPSSVELNVRSDGLQRAVGLWLSPASMINHSCAPSCEWFAIGATLFVVARRAVAAGEELSIAYVDVAPGEAARGAALGLRFACACSRCACERLHDGPAWEAAAARLASRTARHRGGPRAAAGGAQPTALLRSYAAALRARAPPPARAPLVRLSALAGDTALLEGRFAAAAACHERAARLAPAALGAGGAPPAAAAALLAAALCSARAGDAARARGAVERLAAARCAPHAPWARLAPGDLLYLARAHARLDPHAAPLLDALFEQPRRAGGATGDAAAPPVAEVHRYRQ